MHTLTALERLFLGAAPTVLIFLLLHLYLRAVLYRPLQRVLTERRQRSAGLMQAAQVRVGEAESLLRQVEIRLRAARLEGYQRVAERRQAALAERAGMLEQVRNHAKAELEAVQRQLAHETQAGRDQIGAAKQELAEQLIARLLRHQAGPQYGAQPGVSA